MDRSNKLYDTDFYKWTQQQARLIKEGRFDELDLDNLVEEVEDMGKHEPRSLTSHFKQLLMHLLKWQYQPERQSRSWRDSIINHREDAQEVLDDNPGLKPKVPELYEKAYEKAKILAHKQTGLSVKDFPENCPWQLSEIMQDDFIPEPKSH